MNIPVEQRRQEKYLGMAADTLGHMKVYATFQISIAPICICVQVAVEVLGFT
jgi:hypothetical protein